MSLARVISPILHRADLLDLELFAATAFSWPAPRILLLGIIVIAVDDVRSFGCFCATKYCAVVLITSAAMPLVVSVLTSASWVASVGSFPEWLILFLSSASSARVAVLARQALAADSHIAMTNPNCSALRALFG